MLPSSKEVAVLELLAAADELYGLQMVTASAGALKRGTIYVTLARMETKGYVESRLDEAPISQGPPRRVYRLTMLGGRALRAWQMAQGAVRAEHAL